MPELIFVAGCNAAGKSSFIRTRMDELTGYRIIMTDVYKNRSKEIASQAIREKQNIIIETVFNDSSFKDIVDFANNSGYQTSLIVLFLDTVQQSIDRVAFRSLEQNGLLISSGNAKINFNESFKNICYYFLYFDSVDFLYTGLTGENLLIMKFKKSALKKYVTNSLQYPQKFAQFAFKNERLNEKSYNTILNNSDFDAQS